jgi:hypothetical protein
MFVSQLLVGHHCVRALWPDHVRQIEATDGSFPTIASDGLVDVQEITSVVFGRKRKVKTRGISHFIAKVDGHFFETLKKTVFQRFFLLEKGTIFFSFFGVV